MTFPLLLTLLAALGWSAFDATRKRLALRVSPVALTVVLPLGQAPLLALWAATQGAFALPGPALPPMAASVALNVGGLLWFMQAMRLAPLSLTIPLLSLTPVGTTLLGWAFRGQVPGGLQWAGIGAVLAGALVLGLRSGHWPGLGGAWRNPGMRRMAAAALVWSLTAVLDQVALDRGAGAWYASALSAGVGLALGLLLLGRRKGDLLAGALAELRRIPGLTLGTLVLGGAALAVQLEALRLAPVGLVETVKRGVGMAGAVLLGRLFFLERITAAKVAAVVLMTAGVALVMAGG